jgi:small subunit ribosomal protein S4
MDKCSKCRKFGAKLFLKGERCLTPKCAFTRRNYQPGAHGARSSSRKSEYGLQLFEKQKAKAEYGLREREFAKIFRQASKSKANTGVELLRLLEMRLDNIVYKLGWAASRMQARQVTSHRKIKVNDRIVNIPSIVLKPKDKITPAKTGAISPNKVTLPKYLKANVKAMSAEVLRQPERSEIESDLDEQKILEFYSR